LIKNSVFSKIRTQTRLTVKKTKKEKKNSKVIEVLKRNRVSPIVSDRTNHQTTQIIRRVEFLWQVKTKQQLQQEQDITHLTKIMKKVLKKGRHIITTTKHN
jgi:hypothetical protein